MDIESSTGRYAVTTRAPTQQTHESDKDKRDRKYSDFALAMIIAKRPVSALLGWTDPPDRRITRCTHVLARSLCRSCSSEIVDASRAGRAGADRGGRSYRASRLSTGDRYRQHPLRCSTRDCTTSRKEEARYVLMRSVTRASAHIRTRKPPSARTLVCVCTHSLTHPHTHTHTCHERTRPRTLTIHTRSYVVLMQSEHLGNCWCKLHKSHQFRLGQAQLPG